MYLEHFHWSRVLQLAHLKPLSLGLGGCHQQAAHCRSSPVDAGGAVFPRRGLHASWEQNFKGVSVPNFQISNIVLHLTVFWSGACTHLLQLSHRYVLSVGGICPSFPFHLRLRMKDTWLGGWQLTPWCAPGAGEHRCSKVTCQRSHSSRLVSQLALSHQAQDHLSCPRLHVSYSLPSEPVALAAI